MNFKIRRNRLREKYVCHSERSEESLFDLSSMHREILRFAQNDTKTEFYRGLGSDLRFGIQNKSEPN